MREPGSIRQTALQAAAALLLFGSIPVIVRGIAANPYTIGIVRLSIATCGLAAILTMRGELRRLPLRDLLRLGVIGLIFATHWLTLFLGVKTSSASIGAIGLSTYGAHLLILGTLFGRIRPRPGEILAVLLAAAGAILVIPSFDLTNEVVAGMLLSSTSALLYASLPLLHQRWVHIPGNLRALGQFAFALLFFLAFVGKARWELTPMDWAGLLFLAIGVTLIGHSLWVHVTTRLSPSSTSILYYANIPVALLLGALLLGERLTLRTATGGAMIIVAGVLGLVLRMRRESQRAGRV